MDTASTVSSSNLGTAPRGRSVVRAAAVGGVAATVVNLALWVGGRVADVGFEVNPVVGDQVTEVGVVLVALTTLVAFAVGSAALALAARRSRRWVRIVMTAAAVVAVGSATGPVSAADGAATGALLAAMHLVTGAAFVATAARVTSRPASRRP